MLFRKRKNILIYLALIFGAFGLASGKNACKYINYMENSQTSAYKPKNTQIKRAIITNSPIYKIDFELDIVNSQIIIYDIYSNENENGGILEYETAVNSGDLDYTSEFTNNYISYVFYNYDTNNLRFAVILWNNTTFKTIEDINYYNDTIPLTNDFITTYSQNGNYKIATRIINYNSLLSESQIKNNISSITFNNDFIDTQQLQSQVISLQSQVTSLQSQVSTLQSQVTSLQSQVTSLQSQVTSLQSQVTSLQNQLNTLNQEFSDLQDEYDLIYEQNREYYQEIQNKNSIISTLRNTNAQLLEQVSQLQARISELESELAQNLPRNIIDWCKIFASGFVDIFNIEMLPNFKVGYLIVAPLLIGIISLFFKLIRGA